MELVAGHEAGAGDQVGRVDGLRAEAQVRYRLRARLVRVVDEIGLGVATGVLAEDLGAVLVGAHGAVGAEAVEHGADLVAGIEYEIAILAQAAAADVVVDADTEVVLRMFLRQFVEPGPGPGRA